MFRLEKVILSSTSRRQRHWDTAGMKVSDQPYRAWKGRDSRPEASESVVVSCDEGVYR